MEEEGRCAMRRVIPLLLLVVAGALLAGLCTSCSDAIWDPGGISFHLDGPNEVARPQPGEEISFTATGVPADDGVVCENGFVTVDRLETPEGSALTFDDWALRFDGAHARADTVEVTSFQVFTCDDASGTFTMKVDTEFDFSRFEFTGEQDVGRWEIERGTGSYGELSGSGDVTLDYDGDDATYDGDVR